MKSRLSGFGLIELMIAMALGLVVLAGVLVVFIAQRQVYQNSTSQSLIQDADNALSAVITPVVRGAGFTGCGAIGGGGVKTYITGAPTPLTYDTSSAVKGFSANAIPSPLVDGAANDTTKGDWTPKLDTSFVTAGGVAPGSDVLVLIGAPPGAAPVGVTNFAAGAIAVNASPNTPSLTITPSQLVAVSDCGKSSIFQLTGVTAGTSPVLNYTLGPNGSPLYPISSQVIPIQQTAFYVGTDHAGQSALFEAVMSGNAATASWGTPLKVVPGVLNMQVLYGIGNSSQATQYVNAASVTNWTAVTTIKLGFLIEGNQASSTASTNQKTFPLFGNTLTVPTDSRLRHTFYLTVNTRNNTLL